jgi:DNA topoisomerase-2
MHVSSSSYDMLVSSSSYDMQVSGQRKVLFACFKRKLSSEIKVAQLAGYVAEHTAYHHGEASLHGTSCILLLI